MAFPENKDGIVFYQIQVEDLIDDALIDIADILRKIAVEYPYISATGDPENRHMNYIEFPGLSDIISVLFTLDKDSLEDKNRTDVWHLSIIYAGGIPDTMVPLDLATRIAKAFFPNGWAQATHPPNHNSIHFWLPVLPDSSPN